MMTEITGHPRRAAVLGRGQRMATCGVRSPGSAPTEHQTSTLATDTPSSHSSHRQVCANLGFGPFLVASYDMPSGDAGSNSFLVLRAHPGSPTGEGEGGEGWSHGGLFNLLYFTFLWLLRTVY